MGGRLFFSSSTPALSLLLCSGRCDTAADASGPQAAAGKESGSHSPWLQRGAGSSDVWEVRGDIPTTWLLKSSLLGPAAAWDLALSQNWAAPELLCARVRGAAHLKRALARWGIQPPPFALLKLHSQIAGL